MRHSRSCLFKTCQCTFVEGQKEEQSPARLQNFRPVVKWISSSGASLQLSPRGVRGFKCLSVQVYLSLKTQTSDPGDRLLW